ncbi:MAG: GNAT family N-acetyltransferase [Phycisphaerae bacterium]|nr:GNAT family N-acetyltransferase [Phycisphaerae bacterium]
MHDKINIRNAAHHDAERIVHFNKSMARETEDKHLDDRILTSGVNAVLNDPKYGFYLVAEVDGAVVASLMVTNEWSDWRDGVFWWIQSVYVDPAFRRRGIFRAMYKEARNRAASTPQVCGCRLYVEQDNTTARKTYAKLGFKETNYKLYEEIFPSPKDG